MSSRTLHSFSLPTLSQEETTLSDISELIVNPPDFTNVFNAENDINLEERICPSEIPSCCSCAETMKFKSGHDVIKGSHIFFGKYFPIKQINDRIENLVCLALLWFPLQVPQPFIYYHHAIVSEVMETSNFIAKVKLVEFTSVGTFIFKVVETFRELDVRDQNLFHKHYKFPRYNAEDIVKRAKSLLGVSPYELLANNCEHIAVWCISGEHESFQSSETVDKKLRQIFSWILTLHTKLEQYHVVNMATGLTRFAEFVVISLPCLAVAGVFFLIELVLSALRFVKLKSQKERGLICTACYNTKKTFLLSRIITSFFATITLAAIPMFGNPNTLMLVIVCGIAAIYILPFIISVLYRKVKCLINPLYAIPKMVVRKAKHIRPGCSLIIPNDHAILIKSVKRIGPSTKFIGLDIVHFQFRGLLGQRTVISEKFNFKLKSDLLQVCDVPANEVYPDDEVVERALEKAKRREQGFHILFNRSSHIAKQCKIRNYSIFTDVTEATRDVQTGSDVKQGDIVNFRYYALPHKGIVVGKSYDDVVILEFYHVVNGIVQLETREFDLGSGEIEKLIYGIENEQTILNIAERQRGKIVHSFRPYKSSRFVNNCVFPEK